MNLTEVWPEVEQNLIRGRGVSSPNGPNNFFQGGGVQAVRCLEEELDCRLLGDFRLYIERYAPQHGYYFESLAYPFSPEFTLYGVSDFWAEEKNIWWQGERLGEAFETPLAIAIGECAEQGAIVDLSQPQCPVFISDEHGIEPLTDSLADFFRIISFREAAFNPLAALTVDDWMHYDGKAFAEATNYIRSLGYGERLRLWGLQEYE